jgi:hypothetical protein
MRKITLEELKQRREEAFDRIVKLENSFVGHASGNRPRDPEKEKLLIEMDKERLRQYLESGKLQIISPRKWKWRIGR